MTAITAIEKLETTFADLLGVPGAVATGFGRGAIYLALEAVGVRGAAVLVPDLICAQVLEAIRLAGARPVFYSAPLDLSVQPKALAAAFTPDARAAILVHYFGMPQPAIVEMCAACLWQGIAAIEDCSLALLTHTPAGWCGTFSDYAAFSFTKNNWCYGGGLAVAQEPEAVARMRAIRDKKFVADDAFCEAYGRLREVDFEANRLSRASQAAQRGLELQRDLAAQDSRFQHANFFDAASCTAQMSESAARRALHILEQEPQMALRKQALCDQVRRMAGADSGRAQLLWSPHANGSFLPMVFPPGSAAANIQAAAEQGITLRPVWADYQPEVPRTVHSGRMAVLEVHPDLDAAEVGQIGAFLQGAG